MVKTIQLYGEAMKMFLGEYNPNMTDGSRVALPKKLRDQVTGDDVVLAKGFEKCVLVYDKTDWVDRVQKQVEDLSGTTTMRKADLERYLFTSAVEASIDSQGRLVIPQTLLKYADLKKRTAVIGVGDHMEVWDVNNWDTHLHGVSVRLNDQG